MLYTYRYSDKINLTGKLNIILISMHLSKVNTLYIQTLLFFINFYL